MINYYIQVTEIQVIFVETQMPDYIKFMKGFMYGQQDGVILKQEIYVCLPTVPYYANYTPYDQVTEQQAATWMQDAMDPDYTALIQSQLASDMAKVFTEQFPYTKKLPWV